MRDDLMRRISDALDSDEGITGDAELGKILAGDKVASRYARDMARVNRWLATWPATTPEGATMEALAERIEQRLSEPAQGTDDLTVAPNFDDDDALAEATAALTRPGTAAKSKAKGVFKIPPPPRAAAPAEPRAAAVPAPVAAAPVDAQPSASAGTDAALEALTGSLSDLEPRSETSTPDETDALSVERSSLGKLVITKKAVVGGVHEEPAATVGDPRAEPPASALEQSPTSDPGIVLSSPGIELTPEELRAIAEATPSVRVAPEPPVAPPKSLRPKSAPPPLKIAEAAPEPEPVARASSPGSKPKKKKAKRDSGDRFSIPMPEPLPLNAPRFGEPAVPRTPEAPRRSYATWGVLAAAAVVFLGVAVSMELGGEAEPSVAMHAGPVAAVAAVAPAPPAAARPDEPRDGEAHLAEDPSRDMAGVPTLPAAPAAAPPAVVAGVRAEPEAGPVAATVAMPSVADDDGDDSVLARRARTAAPETTTTGTGSAPRAGGASPSADPPPPATGSAGASSGASARGGEASGTGTAGTRTAEGSSSGSGPSGGSAPSGGSTTSAPEGSAATPPPSGGASGGATEAPAEDDSDLLPHPERETVATVLSGVADAVTACAAGEHGTASVFVVVVSSGRVTTATVSGRFAGTPVGSCIARAVRAARFPRFSEPRFEVTYPFSF